MCQTYSFPLPGHTLLTSKSVPVVEIESLQERHENTFITAGADCFIMRQWPRWISEHLHKKTTTSLETLIGFFSNPLSLKKKPGRILT